MDQTRRLLLAGLAIVPLVAACTPRRASLPAVELHIASDGDELAFIPDRLTCAAGADVRLVFRHAGEISSDPHNWVLLKPGTEDAFLADADREQDDTVVVPAEARSMVLAATPMCAKGQTVTIEFIAPAAGRYPFVCSVPGHGETMHGILTVTA